MLRTSKIMRLAALMAIVFVFAACAAKKTPLSAQAQLATNIDDAVAELQKQLDRRSQPGILSLTAPPLTDDPAFAEGLAALFERAASVRSTLVVERLWLQNQDTVRADLHWTLHAEPTGGAAASTGAQSAAIPLSASGSARFTFVGKEPRLTAVQGDSPFSPSFDRPALP